MILEKVKDRTIDPKTNDNGVKEGPELTANVDGINLTKDRKKKMWCWIFFIFLFKTSIYQFSSYSTTFLYESYSKSYFLLLFPLGKIILGQQDASKGGSPVEYKKYL